jgi:hypothetical protein
MFSRFVVASHWGWALLLLVFLPLLLPLLPLLLLPLLLLPLLLLLLSAAPKASREEYEHYLRAVADLLGGEQSSGELQEAATQVVIHLDPICCLDPSHQQVDLLHQPPHVEVTRHGTALCEHLQQWLTQHS